MCALTVRFLAVAQVLTEVQSGFFDRKKAAAPKSRGGERRNHFTMNAVIPRRRRNILKAMLSRGQVCNGLVPGQKETVLTTCTHVRTPIITHLAAAWFLPRENGPRLFRRHNSAQERYRMCQHRIMSRRKIGS